MELFGFVGKNHYLCSRKQNNKIMLATLLCLFLIIMFGKTVIPFVVGIISFIIKLLWPIIKLVILVGFIYLFIQLIIP